jgi:hypothetical protein
MWRSLARISPSGKGSDLPANEDSSSETEAKVYRGKLIFSRVAFFAHLAEHFFA